MNILFKAIYKINRGNKTAYFTNYFLIDRKTFQLEDIDALAKEIAELLVSNGVSLYWFGRAKVDGEITGKSDGSISFSLMIDNQEVFGSRNVKE